MNKLELMGLIELKAYINSIKIRVSDKNKGRMEHERIYLLEEANHAMNIINALEENSKI